MNIKSVTPCGGPTMIRDTRVQGGLPLSVWDIRFPPPEGRHAAPVSREWHNLDAPVEFVTPEQLQVELSHRPGPKPRWSPGEIRAVRRDYWVGGQYTVRDIAALLGTTPQSAANILSGKTYWWC